MGRTSVTSTRTRADLEKARAILSRYALLDVTFVIDDYGYLQAVGEEGTERVVPQAVPVNCLPRKEEFEREYDYRMEVDSWFCEEGDDGFRELLGELAACIESPMTILSVCDDEYGSFANAWIIEPGSAQVQNLHVEELPGGK